MTASLRDLTAVDEEGLSGHRDSVERHEGHGRRDLHVGEQLGSAVHTGDPGPDPAVGGWKAGQLEAARIRAARAANVRVRYRTDLLDIRLAEGETLALGLG